MGSIGALAGTGSGSGAGRAGRTDQGASQSQCDEGSSGAIERSTRGEGAARGRSVHEAEGEKTSVGPAGIPGERANSRQRPRLGTHDPTRRAVDRAGGIGSQRTRRPGHRQTGVDRPVPDRRHRQQVGQGGGSQPVAPREPRGVGEPGAGVIDAQLLEHRGCAVSDPCEAGGLAAGGRPEASEDLGVVVVRGGQHALDQHPDRGRLDVGEGRRHRRGPPPPWARPRTVTPAAASCSAKTWPARAAGSATRLTPPRRPATLIDHERADRRDDPGRREGAGPTGMHRRPGEQRGVVPDLHPGDPPKGKGAGRRCGELLEGGRSQAGPGPADLRPGRTQAGIAGPDDHDPRGLGRRDRSRPRACAAWCPCRGRRAPRWP